MSKHGWLGCKNKNPLPVETIGRTRGRQRARRRCRRSGGERQRSGGGECADQPGTEKAIIYSLLPWWALSFLSVGSLRIFFQCPFCGKSAYEQERLVELQHLKKLSPVETTGRTRGRQRARRRCRRSGGERQRSGGGECADQPGTEKAIINSLLPWWALSFLSVGSLRFFFFFNARSLEKVFL